MSLLQLDGVRKVFPDGTEAVKGLDLSIANGEFIVLLGPSGCGKTTTLRMIAGLETPTAGRIVMDARDVTHLRPGRRDVGFVFQFYALYPHMTVRANIEFPLANTGVGRRERRGRVLEVARRVGLEPLLDRHPGQLSGGDQQRVSLARAMVRRPSVQLMDEPLGTLDIDQRVALREFIRVAQLEMKVTTVYVTHDQEEAMSLADRIVVMDGGQICQAAPPTEVYHSPASLFVANFVGSPGMNIIPGRLEAENGHCRFRPEGGDASIVLERRFSAGPATLGVRPEYVRVDPDGPIVGTVIMNEYQGGFRSIHVDTGFTDNLVMRAAPAAPFHLGQKLRLSFDPAHTRLFDRKRGLSL